MTRHFMLLTILRCTFKYTGLALITGLILITLISALTLGSQTGRQWLSLGIISVLNTPNGIQITLEGLTTPELGQWQIKKLIIKRDKQVWMDIHNVTLQWQPGALLNQALIVDMLSADTFSLYNLPKTQENKQTQASTDTQYPPPLLSVQLKQLAIHTLILHEFLPTNAGSEPPTYSLIGDAKWQKDTPLFANIDIKALTGTPAKLSIRSQSDNIHNLTMTGSFEEEADGFIGQLLQLPKGQKIAAGFDFAMAISKHQFIIDIEKLSFPLITHKVSLTSKFAVTKTAGDVQLDNLTLTIDDTQHTLSGNWVNRQLDLTMDLNRLPLDITTRWIPLLHNASVTAQMAIQGTIMHPRAKGKFVANATYNSMPASIDFIGTLSKQETQIKQLNAHIGKAELSAQGILDIVGNSSEISILANNLNLEKLKSFNIVLPQDLQATLLSGEARLHGSILRPQGDVKFVAQGIYKQQEFELTGDVTKLLDTITINSSTIAAMEGKAYITGDIQASSLEGNLAIKTDSIPLTLLEVLDVSLPQDLTASVNTQFNLSGKLQQPRINGLANIDGHYQENPFSIDLKGQYHSNHIRLDNLNLHAFNRDVLTITGDYQPQHFDLHVNVQQLTLPPEIFNIIGWQRQQGLLSANLQAKGSLKKPQINGNLLYKTALSNLNADREEKRLSWELKVNTQDSENILNLASVLKYNQNTSSELLLQFPLHDYIDYFLQPSHSRSNQDIPLHAVINGTIDLQVLSLLIDPDLHHIGGKINTNIALEGSINAPNAKGSLIIDNARYENTITGTNIYDINCTINSQQMAINISTCKATDGNSGTYAIEGKVQLPINNSPGQITLELETDDANILQRPDIEGEVTGKITLTGNFKELLATSDLEISPFTALVDATSSHGIPHIEVKEIYAESSSSDKTTSKSLELPTIILDLLISANQQAYLRGHGLEAELKGQIRLKGDVKKPRYEGNFKTVRGVFEIFGKKFKLEQGQVSFANNIITMSLTGIYQKNDQQISALITGNNENFKLSLSAVPSLPEDEILAFIIFGKTLQKITPFEAIQLASAVQTLRGGGSFFDPIGSTREVLGVDTLSIEAEKTDSGDNGVNVGVGKYINEKVYLELERTPNPSQPWKGKLEIELTPNLNLESSTGGTSGIEGAQIKWKREY